jgi:hypothetical protein
MFYERLHVTFVGVVATLVGSVVVAEFAGYWLHRLLHSDKVAVFSRGHLVHHFSVSGVDESELFSLPGCSKALFRKDGGGKTALRGA